VWCVERIICISVHLWDHENSLSLGIYTSRLGDHIQEAPLPVVSATVAFAICEVLDALDCWPGTCNWTGNSEVVVTGNKKACGEGLAKARGHETQNRGRENGQSATLGVGRKFKFMSVYLLFLKVFLPSDRLSDRIQFMLRLARYAALFLLFQVENLIDHDQVSKQLNPPYWLLLLKVRWYKIAFLFYFSRDLKREL